MSSYLNNLLTTTTSRYNSLRRTLLSDEADGDTEDDSHISRVLRAYYTEKGRPFPPWLPPDPKAPQQVPTQFVSSSGRGPGAPAAAGRGRGLSDLWDAPQQQAPPQEPPSLRNRAQVRSGGAARRPGMVESHSADPRMLSRPLPSQRAGSYQSSQSFGRPADPSPPPSSGSGTTAQERLKARLWGSSRSISPAGGAGSGGSTSPSQLRSPFERPAGNPSSGGRPSYPDDRSGGYPGHSQSYGGGGPYDRGNAYGGPPPPGRERTGLPNGPRRR